MYYVYRTYNTGYFNDNIEKFKKVRSAVFLLFSPYFCVIFAIGNDKVIGKLQLKNNTNNKSLCYKCIEIKSIYNCVISYTLALSNPRCELCLRSITKLC